MFSIRNIRKEKIASSVLRKINAFEILYGKLLDIDPNVRTKIGDTRSFFTPFSKVKAFFEGVKNGKIKDIRRDYYDRFTQPFKDLCYYRKDFEKGLSKGCPERFANAHTEEDSVRMKDKYYSLMGKIFDAIRTMFVAIEESEDKFSRADVPIFPRS